MIADVTPPTDRPMGANINVRMTLEQRAALQDVADELGVDVSTVARVALGLGLPNTRSAIENAIDEAQSASITDAVRSRAKTSKRR
jgi:hypothetical protein